MTDEGRPFLVAEDTDPSGLCRCEGPHSGVSGDSSSVSSTAWLMGFRFIARELWL